MKHLSISYAFSLNWLWIVPLCTTVVYTLDTWYIPVYTVPFKVLRNSETWNLWFLDMGSLSPCRCTAVALVV